MAFPTETVYGLGADASNAEALKRLYAVKGRPSDHPVIVHLASAQDMDKWAVDIPPLAYKLAEAFWPGPMTLILKKAHHVSPLVTGGQNSVGLRVPAHDVAQRLIKTFGGGVAAPSANRFGRLSPTTAQAVAESLGADVEMILDGGPCAVGIESTIISLLNQSPAILRPGMLDRASIEALIGDKISCPTGDANHSGRESAHARVPGALPSHYAPHTPLAVQPAANLIELFGEGVAIGRNQAVIAFAPTVQLMKNNFGQGFFNAMEYEALITAPTDVNEYARLLYDSLRQLDNMSLHKILVESVPLDAAWDGIRDRLQRASAEGNRNLTEI